MPSYIDPVPSTEPHLDQDPNHLNKKNEQDSDPDPKYHVNFLYVLSRFIVIVSQYYSQYIRMDKKCNADMHKTMCKNVIGIFYPTFLQP